VQRLQRRGAGGHLGHPAAVHGGRHGPVRRGFTAAMVVPGAGRRAGAGWPDGGLGLGDAARARGPRGAASGEGGARAAARREQLARQLLASPAPACMGCRWRRWRPRCRRTAWRTRAT
jgi:hypothetical protein